MNPFDALSDDPILHIMSFLPGKDLLKLSAMDRKFKRIVTTSKETKAKIRLVLGFMCGDNLDDVIEFARNRPFTALKLIGVYYNTFNGATDSDSFARPVKLALLLEVLSGSVEDLIIERNEFGEENFRDMIGMFLPS